MDGWLVGRHFGFVFFFFLNPKKKPLLTNNRYGRLLV
jgi:hypothetical protein